MLKKWKEGPIGGFHTNLTTTPTSCVPPMRGARGRSGTTPNRSSSAVGDSAWRRRTSSVWCRSDSRTAPLYRSTPWPSISCWPVCAFAAWIRETLTNMSEFSRFLHFPYGLIDSHSSTTLGYVCKREAPFSTRGNNSLLDHYSITDSANIFWHHGEIDTWIDITQRIWLPNHHRHQLR